MSAIRWLGLRPHRYGSDETGVYGFSAVAVGLGEGGAAWLARLTGSAWLAGVGLQANDLLAGRANFAAGAWDMAGGELPPHAPLIALAVDQPALVDDAAVTYAVSMLGVLGRVIVTMPGSNGAANLAGSLQKAGAFVVTGALGVLLDHLHHFPLRMAITSLHGQLVSTDLADTLEVCRPGETATVLCCPNLTEADRVYPHLLGLDLAVPDHSTLSRKAETLQVALPRRGAGPVHPSVLAQAPRRGGH